jgi:hypothetical protein
LDAFEEKYGSSEIHDSMNTLALAALRDLASQAISLLYAYFQNMRSHVTVDLS